MKNENLNLINVLLVVAIVLAVGGTWLNLNKLSEVNKVTLAGYAIAAGPGAAQSIDVVNTVNALLFMGDPSVPGTFVSTTPATIDCYLATWNGTTGLADTTPCSTATNGNMSNITVELKSNQEFNVTGYFTKVIAVEYQAGTLNHNYIGYVTNVSGSLGGATNHAANTYLNADSATSGSPLYLVENADVVPVTVNLSLNWAKTIDVLTPTGTYSNVLNIELTTLG